MFARYTKKPLPWVIIQKGALPENYECITSLLQNRKVGQVVSDSVAEPKIFNFISQFSGSQLKFNICLSEKFKICTRIFLK